MYGSLKVFSRELLRLLLFDVLLFHAFWHFWEIIIVSALVALSILVHYNNYNIYYNNALEKITKESFNLLIIIKFRFIQYVIIVLLGLFIFISVYYSIVKTKSDGDIWYLSIGNVGLKTYNIWKGRKL